MQEKSIQGRLPLRIIMAVVGVTFSALSIGMFKNANFGIDPFQIFCNGLAVLIPIPFGTLYMLINLALLVLVFFLDRHYIGVSTMVNLFLLGYMVEFFEALFARIFPAPSMALRIAYLVVGVIITCIGAALYYTANLGVSTYDAIPLHLSDLKPKLLGRVVPFRLIRIATDLVCTAVGFSLGVKVGVGTLVTALFMGPLISFFRRTLSDPLLYGRGGAGKAA